MNNDEIIQTLLQEAVSQILEGISPQDASAVSVEFEHLLTRCLVKNDQTPSPEDEGEILRAGRYIIEETCKVPSKDRREHIQRELLIEEISDVDAEARKIAEDSLKESPDLPTLRVQSGAIHDQLRELRGVLQTKGPDWEQAFTRMLSEASMDCLFVLGETPYSSLRLGRKIRFMQETGNWPPAWYAELWLKETNMDQYITMKSIRAERARLKALGQDASVEAAVASLRGGKNE
jgi:hypothetical protein